MSAEVHTGGCLCGETRYIGTGDIERLSACHCRQCQQWSGGPYFSVKFSEGAKITNGEPNWYQSSDFAERGFCPNCGSPLFWRVQGNSKLVVSAGSLDDPNKIERISRHIFIDHKPNWLTFADDAPNLTEADCIAAYEARTSQ